MAAAAAAELTPEGLARLGELREEAYTKVLRAFTQQTFDWKREKVLGNLRKELQIGEDAHAEIMDCVLSGKDPPRLVAAATARAQVQQEPALPSARHQGMAGTHRSAGFGGPGSGGGGDGHFAHAYSRHGSPAVMDGGGAHTVRRHSLEAGPMGMPTIPTSAVGGGYPPHAPQQFGGGGGQWQRGNMSPHQLQQQMQQSQQSARQHAHGGGGYMRHPAQQNPYGSPSMGQQPAQASYPQLPHHHMQPSPQGGRPGDYAPTYASPYGGGQAALVQQQQQQQHYAAGGGAARELWPPQQGGRPGPQQQHMHNGMPSSGSGGGHYADGYGVGAPGPSTPPAAHAAAYAASPVGGGRGLKGGGSGGQGPGGKPGAKGRPPVKKRPAPGGDDVAAPPKQAKKKKGEGQSPALPGVQAPVAGASALRLDALLGHRVKVYWPADGGWWDGVITDFNALTGQHCVVYEYGTPNESFEWTQIRGAHSGEVQVLDDTVDLLQARPHGSGVPQQMSHAMVQPPKAAAKPGRKPKAAPVAGNDGVSAPIANGRPASAHRAPPPKAKPKMPNGLAHSGYQAADEYREQHMPQSAAPPAVPQQAPQHTYRPPPVQDDGYGFRVVGDNTDSDSDSEQYSNESYD